MTASSHGVAPSLTEALRHHFETHGYTGAHIATILREAGVSRTAFYERFASKADAYRAVMGSDPPDDPGELTARAQRTRVALVAATRTCVERDGYHRTRIADIAAQAGTSVGSFYTYFTSKIEVFTLVVERAVADYDRAGRDPDIDRTDRGSDGPQDRIRHAAADYYDRYDRHARLVMRIDEAIGTHPELTALRLQMHATFADRISASIRRWQREGLAATDIDAGHAGHALAAMVGHSTQVWRAYGQEHDRDAAIATLATLWARGVGLR